MGINYKLIPYFPYIIEKRSNDSHDFREETILKRCLYMRVAAPEIARQRKAGQFVIIQLDIDYGERIPLTIADADPAEGWIALVIQAVGATTIKLCQKEVGDSIAAILGPLGNPTHIAKVGKVVCVGGGIGTAPLHPLPSL